MMWSDLPGSVLAADVAVRAVQVARTTSLRPGVRVVDVRAPGATPVEPGPARIAAVAEALARTSRTRRSSRAATGRLRDAGPRSSHVLQPQQLTACCQSSPSHQHPSPRWTTFFQSSLLNASTANTMAMTASLRSMICRRHVFVYGFAHDAVARLSLWRMRLSPQSCHKLFSDCGGGMRGR